MAKPGYGKRTASDQHPRTLNDFILLPTRERYVAGFIDHLPETAAMSVKVLAQQLPLYGQQAIGSALRALSVAGHLRRVRCEVGAGGPGPLGLPHVLVPYRAGQRVVERLSGHRARPVHSRYGAHPGARPSRGRCRARSSPATVGAGPAGPRPPAP